MTEVDQVWAALSEPTRRSIVDALRHEPATTGMLEQHLESHGLRSRTRFGTLHHLKVLREAGLVAVVARGRQRWNYLNASALYQATIGWLDPAQHQAAAALSHLKNVSEAPFPTQRSNIMIDSFEIHQEIQINASASEVFAALTTKSERWWGDPYLLTEGPGETTISFDLRAGGDVVERRGNYEALWGTVSTFAPDKILEWSGSMGMGGGTHSCVRFELTQTGGGTRVTFNQTSFGLVGDNRESYSYGWDDLLCRFKTLIETGECFGIAGKNSEATDFTHQPQA